MKDAQDIRFTTTYDGANPALENVIPTGVQTALDVGCGCGGTANWLASRGIATDGVTWNSKEADEARRHCRTVFVHDVSAGLPDILVGSYDLVICSHLLEHIAYPQALLADIHRVLRPGGALVVAVPNLFFWRERLKLVRGKWDYQESGTFDYTHLRWYTRDSMERLASTHGFVAEAFWADGWIPLPGLRYLLGKRRRAAINQFACRVLPGLLGVQFLFRFRRIQIRQ